MFSESEDFEDPFVVITHSERVANASSDQSAAAIAAQRAAGGARSAAVRFRFIARKNPAGVSPPLARLLRGGGGRGGTARLRLYLSMLWLARNEDAPVFSYPAHQWARLLGLDDPDTTGARRVQESLRWLNSENFVRLERRRGAPSNIHLLDDAGSGKPYTSPGLLVKALAKRPTELEEHLYVQLSAAFWTRGWVRELSGAAVAMYLVLLHEQRGDPDKSVWIAPSVGHDVYDLSDETRRKGLNELVKHEMASVRRRPVRQGLFTDQYRGRNVYDLHPGAMG